MICRYDSGRLAVSLCSHFGFPFDRWHLFLVAFYLQIIWLFNYFIAVLFQAVKPSFIVIVIVIVRSVIKGHLFTSIGLYFFFERFWHCSQMSFVKEHLPCYSQVTSFLRNVCQINPNKLKKKKKNNERNLHYIIVTKCASI